MPLGTSHGGLDQHRRAIAFPLPAIHMGMIDEHVLHASVVLKPLTDVLKLIHVFCISACMYTYICQHFL